MANPDLRRQVVQAAMREAKLFKQRYAEYRELAEVFAAIDRTAERIAA